MDMTGEQRINAPRARVWEALNDPEILRQAIPGCETLVLREENGVAGYDATVSQKIGPIQARFKGKVQIADLVPPTSYRLSGEGSGGAAGFAKGEAQIHLDDDGSNGTKLTFSVKANVGGKLAQIGQRLIDQTAKSLADEFFERFAKLVSDQPAAPAMPSADAILSAAAPTQMSQDRGLPPFIWIAGFVAAVLILVAVFAML